MKEVAGTVRKSLAVSQNAGGICGSWSSRTGAATNYNKAYGKERQDLVQKEVRAGVKSCECARWWE